jgi:3-oxoacyl-[acyl-carrier protein] reductase
MSNSILKGKNAFISGATGSIGKSIAFHLAKEGCNIFITSTNKNKLEKLKSELKEYKVKVILFPGDLDNDSEVKSIIKATKEMGYIDILINCAGVFPNMSIFQTSDKDFDRTMNINLKSAFIFTKTFAKSMVKKSWGRIVNIGSSSSYSGYRDTSIYCSSKHALLGFSKSIHDELKEYNVRSYCISPSSTTGNMGLSTKSQDYSTFLDPDDIAKYIIFSISFDSNIVSEELQLKRIIVR